MIANQYKAKDEQLFAEVQKLMDGKFDSYEQVYELSKKYIYKIINDIVQNHHTTEDMMQETYIQIYNKIGTLRDARSFYVWAGRIASNLTLRHLQKYRKEFIQSASGEDDEDFMFDKLENDHEAFIPETVLENEEQQRIIAGIIDELSPEQKLTVQYYYFEEMSVNDIAETMECSTGTVKSRLNYARKSLKDAVNKFEKNNDVKLYSISGLPIFYLVFRASSEGWFAAASGAAVATGGAAVGSASGSAVAEAGSVVAEAGSIAVETSSVAGAAGTASTGASTVVASTSVASATAATAGGGFLSTVVGKVVIVVVTVVVGAGSATAGAAISENALKDSGRYESVMEQVEASKSDESLNRFQDVLKNLLNNRLENNSTITDADTSADSIHKLMGDASEELNYYLQETDEDYVNAMNKLAASIVKLQEALEYSLTPEQNAYMDGYTQIMYADTSGNFKNNYYPRLIAILEEEADILDGMADFYYTEEAKREFAKHSVAEMEEILQMGAGIGNLIVNDISESAALEMDAYTRQLMDVYMEAETLLNEMISDPALSQYIQ